MAEMQICQGGKTTMRFKSQAQRRAVMAKLTYNQLRKRNIYLPPRGDADRDGVKNKNDCRPLNARKQGFFHKWQIKRLKAKEEKLETKREKAQKKLNDTLDTLKEKRKVSKSASAVKTVEVARKQAVIDEINRERAQAQKLREANQKAKAEIEKYSAWGKAKTFSKRVGIGIGRASKAGFKATTSKKAKKGYKRVWRMINK